MSSQTVKISSSKIKDAIGSLCKFLNLSGFTHISPETFRQAKFNKEDATGPMLILLGELLEFSTTEKLSKIFTEYKNDLIYSLHSKLLAKQYTRQTFYDSLDLVNSRCNSSQELLIAVGWLIATEDLLKRMVLKDMHRLPFYPDVTQKLEEGRYCVKTVRDSSQTVDVEGKLNQLIWDIGRCQMASKQLHWKQLEVVRLVHKIHSSTHGVSLTKDRLHLSPADVFVLRFEAELQKHLSDLEKENRRLQMYYQWQEKEEIFWHWMESVTLSKTVTTASSSPSVQPSPIDLNEHLLAGEQSEALDNCHLMLGNTLKKLKGKLQQCTPPKQRLEFESFHQEDSKGDAGNCDGFKSREFVGKTTLSHPRKETDAMAVTSHFQFIPKRMRDSSSNKVSTSEKISGLGLNSKDISDEISELTKQLTSLKDTLSNQKGINKDLCNSIFAEVSGVISIPPISSNKM